MSTPVLVQVFKTIGALNTTNTTFGVTGLTSGNLLLIELIIGNNNPLNTTVSIPTFTLTSRGSAYNDPTGIQFFTGPIPSSGDFTITVNKNSQSAIVGLIVRELSGVDSAVVDGAAVFATGTSTAPTVAMNSTAVSTDYLVCAYSSFTPITLTTPVSGWTNDQSQTNASFFQADEVQGTSTSGSFTAGWTSISNANSRVWNIGALAIRGVPTTPTITDTATTSATHGSAFVINGLNFGASQGTGTVTIGGTTCTVTSWSATSITVTANRGTNKYGTALNVIVNTDSAGSSNTFSLIGGVIPPANRSYINLGTPNSDSTKRITSSTDLASGDQIEYESKSGLVTVYTDGTFSAPLSINGFNAAVWTTGGYGPDALQLLSAQGSVRMSFNLF